MHHRLVPGRHRFIYKIFMFCLDLDEVNELARRFWLIGYNSCNVFSFRDNDHAALTGDNLRDRIVRFARASGIDQQISRILLVTHLRTFGYVFNPVSFFYCFGPSGDPICCVVEVGNTFRELKMYILGPEDYREGMFQKKIQKLFYVSPFIDLDTWFDFRILLPSETLEVRINDYKDDVTILLTSLIGRRLEMTNGRVLWYAIRFPLVTLKVITLIHWQAFLLWAKRLPYRQKKDNPELQKGIRYARR